jgi:hypothetical protein
MTMKHEASPDMIRLFLGTPLVNPAHDG